MTPDAPNRRPGISPARTLAFEILLRVEREDSYASELLHSVSSDKLSASDHGLATELVLGVLRWRSRLDEDIAKASSQAIAKLDLEVLLALRLAVYQLRWLDRIPARAAIHESVELVKRARKRSAAPFVNAILRKLANETASGKINHSPFTAEDLALQYAHPVWLVERWVRQYGLSAAECICRHDQSVPGTAVRFPDSMVEADLASEHIVLSAGVLLASARAVQKGSIANTKAFREGRVVIQDEGSQLIALLVGGGSRILDCCAAPGGKTRVMAERNPDATITAVEIHTHRARLLKRMLGRRRLNASAPAERIQVVVADARSLPSASSFDRILADVPCSGTGTLARNPEIKWRLRQEDLMELQGRQTGILSSALQHVAPGGRLVYSTCSLEKQENEDVVKRALDANAGFALVDCRRELDRLRAEGELIYPDADALLSGPYLRTIPGLQPCDGFFAAILERI